MVMLSHMPKLAYHWTALLVKALTRNTLVLWYRNTIKHYEPFHKPKYRMFINFYYNQILVLTYSAWYFTLAMIWLNTISALTLLHWYISVHIIQTENLEIEKNMKSTTKSTKKQVVFYFLFFSRKKRFFPTLYIMRALIFEVGTIYGPEIYIICDIPKCGHLREMILFGDR